ncbi:Integrator complex subunit 4 [Nosema granulosis]|uniref:Integrator complex subunit 4 n=1 Tax=Nosema granulosis TaxID=83296 RepID=A0A9P6H045_9MICR|nr:Integrator complex subunit 4 [Nosema granulosis]
MQNGCNFNLCMYFQNLLDTKEFSKFSCCPQEYHIQVYLENFLQENKSIEKEELQLYFRNKSPKVRLIAAKLYIKLYGYDKSCKFCYYDPFYRVRLLSVPHIKLGKLLDMMEDENVSVKIAVLEQLIHRDIVYQKKIYVLNNIGKCIVHPNMNIRLLAAKLLGTFVGLEPETMDILLSKKDEEVKDKNICGLVVYGLEDEFSEVRQSTIESLFYLSNESTISKTFEYFIDTLNDESIDVRRTTLSCIKKILEKYKLVVDYESTKQICFLFKENDCSIRNNIVQIISRLGYKDIECILEIIESVHKHLSRADILKIFLYLFKNNTELIFNNIGRFYQYSPFLEHQTVLTDTKYFCILLIISLCTFNGLKIKLDRNTRKHIRYIIQELSTSVNCELANLKDFIKDSLAKFIESKAHQGRFEEIFRKRKQAPDFYKFAVRLTKYLKGDRSKILKLNYLFSNINLSKRVLENDLNLIAFIYDLDFELIKQINNDIILINEPIIKNECVIDFEFSIETPFTNASLVLEDDKGRRIVFSMDSTLKISILNENSSWFKYYLEVDGNGSRFVISKVKTISKC